MILIELTISALLWILLNVIMTVFIRGDDSCPDSKAITPCTCDGEGLSCMGDRTFQEIENAFKANFKYGGIRSVWIQGTKNITKVTADLFGNVKSQQFYIEVNNIASVDLKAFSASKKILSTLSLFGNKLDKLDYSGITDYDNLVTLNLGRNEITSIPDNAFNSRSLNTIILAQNKISHIGMNAFSNLPNIMRLELSLNSLTALEPMSFALKSHSSSLQINLSSNQISSISTLAFERTRPYVLALANNMLTSLPYDSFGDLVTRIGTVGGFLEVTGNPFTCIGCDYSWLVLNKYILHTKFVGFTCTDGRSIIDLTKLGIQCSN